MNGGQARVYILNLKILELRFTRLPLEHVEITFQWQNLHKHTVVQAECEQQATFCYACFPIRVFWTNIYRVRA